MVDIGGIFGGGFAQGFQDSQNNLLGQRQKTAELFLRYQQQNPTATFEQYQDFLNQVSPDRFLRGPGYSDQALQQLADESQRKLKLQQEKDRLGLIQDQIKTQDTYRNFVDSAVTQALNASGENDSPDDIRQRVKKSLGSSGVPVDGQIGELADSIDYTGRLKEHRLNKLKKEQEDVDAASKIYAGTDLSPDAIEAELKNRGFSEGVAKSARTRLEKERNDVRAKDIIALGDAMRTDPSSEGILLDPNQNLGDYVEGYAKKRQLKLTIDEKEQLRSELELRRKAAIEKQDTANVEQTTKAKSVADSMANLDSEDEVRRALSGQNMSQGMTDAILGQWRSGRNGVYIQREQALRDSLNPAKNALIAGYVADEKPEAIKLVIQNTPGLKLPEDRINALVTEFMQGKVALARDSLGKDMEQNIKVLQDRMATQTQTNIKSFADLEEIHKDDKKLQRIYAVGKLVAARNVDATVGQIEGAVRAAISKNSSTNDGDIVDAVTAALPNAQQAIVKEQQLYKNPIDQKKTVSELYSTMGRISTAYASVIDIADRYKEGDMSALGKQTPADFKTRIIPGIIADIDAQITKINAMLRMRDSSMLNLTPEGAQKFEGFIDGLTRTRAELVQRLGTFDIKNPGAGADLERRRIQAEQTRDAGGFRPETAAAPQVQTDPTVSAARQDLSRWISDSGRELTASQVLQQIGGQAGMVASPMGYLFNTPQQRADAAIVQKFATSPGALTYFKNYPGEIELFKQDPVGYAKRHLQDLQAQR
jgi:hypothetical protein